MHAERGPDGTSARDHSRQTAAGIGWQHGTVSEVNQPCILQFMPLARGKQCITVPEVLEAKHAYMLAGSLAEGV